jgi:hypothetical protein
MILVSIFARSQTALDCYHTAFSKITADKFSGFIKGDTG